MARNMTLDSPSAQTRRCMSDTPQAAEADPHYHMPVPNLGFPQFSECLTITPVAHVRNLSYLTFVFTPHILFCHQMWSRLQLNFLRLSLFLCRTPPSVWAKFWSHPSSPAPGHTPTLAPYEGQAHPPWGASKQGSRLFVLTPPVPAGPPIKPCLKKKKKTLSLPYLCCQCPGSTYQVLLRSYNFFLSQRAQDVRPPGSLTFYSTHIALSALHGCQKVPSLCSSHFFTDSVVLTKRQSNLPSRLSDGILLAKKLLLLEDSLLLLLFRC